MRKTLLVAVLGLLLLAGVAMARFGPHPAPVVYVTSQDKCYQSIITADPLPWKGPFQQLMGDGVKGDVKTEWGIGDKGYVGGRWWMDTNPNGYQDAVD